MSSCTWCRCCSSRPGSLAKRPLGTTSATGLRSSRARPSRRRTQASASTGSAGSTFSAAAGAARLPVSSKILLENLLRHEDVLRLEEIVDVARAAVDIGVRKIRLTGGEPLMHPEFLSLLDIIRREELRLTVETNGLLCY